MSIVFITQRGKVLSSGMPLLKNMPENTVEGGFAIGQWAKVAFAPMQLRPLTNLNLLIEHRRI